LQPVNCLKILHDKNLLQVEANRPRIFMEN
jgi:hypothetical protein